MRKRKHDVIQLLILTVLGAAVVFTLALPQLPRGKSQLQPLTLSVLAREPDASLWSNARLGMEQAADELDAELRFLTLTSANDSQEQVQLLLREIEGGADGIIISPADSSQISQALDQLPSPCPVVCLESPMAGAAGVISPDNTLLGQSLAQAVMEDWDGGTVLLLDTAGPCSAVSDRLWAAQRTLEDAGIPTSLGTAQSEELSGGLAQLLQDSRAKWVMAFEPSATLTAAAAQTGVPLYGVGTSSAVAARLEDGDITAAAVWSDYAAGYLAVAQAIAAAQAESNPSASLNFSILRGEDIYEPDNQKLLFPVTT